MKPPFLRTITLIPLRRPKGKVQVQLGPKEDPTDPYKDRAAWLLEGLNASYSHRAGYALSPARAEAFVRLYNGGWSASRRFLESDKTPVTFSPRCYIDKPHSLKEALSQCP